MPGILDSKREFFFRLKPSVTVDAVASAFSNYFAKQNRYDWYRFVSRSYISGRIRMVLAETTWGFTGVTSAILLFYVEHNNTCRVQILGFYRGRKIGRLDKRLLEQTMGFFEGGGSNLIQMMKDEAESAKQAARATTEPQPEEEQTPTTTCHRCGTVNPVLGSSYCCSCGTRLTRLKGSRPTALGEEMPTSSTRHASDLPEGNCMICRIGLATGELLAWCPRCGAVAHRIHMFEWLRVKGTCASCGQHLTVSELADQFSQAHLQPEIEESGSPS